MLKPAICYKTEIENAIKQFYYTDDMMYYTGSNHSSSMEIPVDSNDGDYHYAVTGTDGRLIGYITYYVDRYSSCARGFGAFSFERGNIIMGQELLRLFERLINTLHRVEFRAVEGNPAVKHYDRFLQLHADIGKKHILTDAFKDTNGKYHDDYIYEFVNRQEAAENGE